MTGRAFTVKGRKYKSKGLTCTTFKKNLLSRIMKPI